MQNISAMVPLDMQSIICLGGISGMLMWMNDGADATELKYYFCAGISKEWTMK